MPQPLPLEHHPHQGHWAVPFWQCRAAHGAVVPTRLGWAWPGRVVVACLAGRMRCTRHGDDLTLALLQPGAAAGPPVLRTAGPARLGYFALNDALLRQAAAELAQPAEAAQALAALPRHDLALLRLLADYARRALENHAPATRLEMDSRAALISLHLLRHHGRVAHKRAARCGRGGLAPWQLARACDTLLRDLAYPVPLAELAAQAGLSRFHFARAFKQSTGFAPFGWLTEQRLLRAESLLRGPQAPPIGELAAALGYGGASQFTRMFRRHRGMAPGEFQRAAAIGA